MWTIQFRCILAGFSWSCIRISLQIFAVVQQTGFRCMYESEKNLKKFTSTRVPVSVGAIAKYMQFSLSDILVWPHAKQAKAPSLIESLLFCNKFFLLFSSQCFFSSYFFSSFQINNYSSAWNLRASDGDVDGTERDAAEKIYIFVHRQSINCTSIFFLTFSSSLSRARFAFTDFVYLFFLLWFLHAKSFSFCTQVSYIFLYSSFSALIFIQNSNFITHCRRQQKNLTFCWLNGKW